MMMIMMTTMTLMTMAMIVAGVVAVMTNSIVIDLKKILQIRKACMAEAHLRMLRIEVLQEVDNVTRGL
jgi:hypothetical protein